MQKHQKVQGLEKELESLRVQMQGQKWRNAIAGANDDVQAASALAGCARQRTCHGHQVHSVGQHLTRRPTT